MKNFYKTPAFAICLMTLFLAQTACISSYYRIIESEPPPALGKGNITGTVFSETDGKPLENVDVLLCRDVVMLAGCSGQIGQAKTNQDGVYWFRNLPPGEYVPAIKTGENKLYVLQETKRGETFPKAVLFNLVAGQTIQIEPQKVNIESQSGDENAVKLKYPINFETIHERRPNLAWEANPNAEAYGPYLVKLNSSNGEKTDVELEIAKLSFVKSTSVAPLKELEDGIYEWGVYPSLKQNSGTTFLPKISKGYFVVIGSGQTEK